MIFTSELLYEHIYMNIKLYLELCGFRTKKVKLIKLPLIIRKHLRYTYKIRIRYIHDVVSFVSLDLTRLYFFLFFSRRNKTRNKKLTHKHQRNPRYTYDTIQSCFYTDTKFLHCQIFTKYILTFFYAYASNNF